MTRPTAPAYRLADQPSLYLRQHADNPVQWWPWCDEALAEARRLDHPILLSIGYSACHWCHVMAHECFDSPAIAEQMNADFVCIKVDRELRPDLDRIYQLAHQALARRGGGWPLTVFLDPQDLLPFYAGTYFPPMPQRGMPSFPQVLAGVGDWFRNQRDQVRAQNQALGAFLAQYGQDPAVDTELSGKPQADALARMLRGFDPENGGWAGAPKFPHSAELTRLLRESIDSVRPRTLCTITLQNMARRGLYDHLAGGFFRYCVDGEWRIPHFEKMLYDNALLLPLYAEASVRWQSEEFAQTAGGVMTWLDSEMRLDDGTYASAIDADSDGEEGAFYVWTREQFAEALAPEQLTLASQAFGLDGRPNFDDEAWHLQRDHPVAEACDLEQLQRIRDALLHARSRRVRPARDDKALTAWNALLALGMSRAGRFLQRDDWRDRASELLDRLLQARDARGRVSAVVHAPAPGFLDDHAYLLAALLDSLAGRWRDQHLAAAQQLAETLLADFEDREHGGFFFTGHDHEALPQRPKPWLDEATPAGNGIAAMALLRLGYLLAEPRYLAAAERGLRAAWSTLSEQPHAAGSLLDAWKLWHAPEPVIVLGAGANRAEWAAAIAELERQGLPVFQLSADSELLPALREKALSGSAFVCQGRQCLEPAATPHELRQRLASLPQA